MCEPFADIGQRTTSVVPGSRRVVRRATPTPMSAATSRGSGAVAANRSLARREPMMTGRRGRGNRLMRQGPWTGRYPAAAAMVIFALVPYLALSAALQPITPIIARDLHASLQTMSLGSGLANAGYAVGTVLAVFLAQHLPQRRMMVLYAALLVIGSVLTAAAQIPGTV